MFTGIIEEVGTVEAISALGDSVRLTVRGPAVVADAKHGDSIAVNGVCLTVVEQTPESFTADVMRETLERSSLKSLTQGSGVNLERAMSANARLGGHIVQGHVDGVGTIAALTPSEHWTVVRVAIPATLAQYVVEKGSITLNGVSLTVSGVSEPAVTEPWLEVSLIPATLALTTFGSRAVGDAVNLEVDVIAKYVERLLAVRANQNGSIGE